MTVFLLDYSEIFFFHDEVYRTWDATGRVELIKSHSWFYQKEAQALEKYITSSKCTQQSQLQSGFLQFSEQNTVKTNQTALQI